NMQNYDSSSSIASVCKILKFILITTYISISVLKAQQPLFSSGVAIVLDPGHGGKDEGAIGKLCSEKQVCLSICNKIQHLINDQIPDAAVFFTRQTDTFIPLHARSKMANELNADLFISVHCNALPGNHASVRGTETYVMGLHKAESNLNVAKRENAAIFLESITDNHYDVLNFENPESFIVLNHLQDQFIQQSNRLAKSVEDAFAKRHPGKSKGVKQAGFHVLHQVSMPGILVECGYMTNSDEEKYLCSSSGQWEIAQMIVEGISNHLLVNPVYPTIAMSEPTKKTGTLKKEANDLIYKIQLASSRSCPAPQSSWRANPEFEIIKEGELYRLVYGSFLSLEEARKEKEIMSQKGFHDAFIIKYAGDRKIN
ncbi:MAG: N-acetylmuramoyl-L-alanine amidase, partial [Saprospiraceae bacterium]